MTQNTKELFFLLSIFTLLLIQTNIAQSNATPVIVNNNYLHNSYKQTNCNLFPDSNKGFIATWDDYRFGDVQKYAQKYDANSNKVGSEFQINNYILISDSS